MSERNKVLGVDSNSADRMCKPSIKEKIISRISKPLYLDNETQKTIFVFLRENEDVLLNYEENDNLIFLVTDIQIFDYDLEENRELSDTEYNEIGYIGELNYSIREKNELYIYEIFVSEDYRKMKIASNLVKKMLDIECIPYIQIQWDNRLTSKGKALKKYLDSIFL